jgi:hypothetical protein
MGAIPARTCDGQRAGGRRRARNETCRQRAVGLVEARLHAGTKSGAEPAPSSARRRTGAPDPSPGSACEHGRLGSRGPGRRAVCCYHWAGWAASLERPGPNRGPGGPWPNSRSGSHVLRLSAARICVVRLRQDAADVAAMRGLRFHFRLCWRSVPCDPLQPAQ